MKAEYIPKIRISQCLVHNHSIVNPNFNRISFFDRLFRIKLQALPKELIQEFLYIRFCVTVSARISFIIKNIKLFGLISI